MDDFDPALIANPVPRDDFDLSLIGDERPATPAATGTDFDPALIATAPRKALGARPSLAAMDATAATLRPRLDRKQALIGKLDYLQQNTADDLPDDEGLTLAERRATVEAGGFNTLPDADVDTFASGIERRYADAAKNKGFGATALDAIKRGSESNAGMIVAGATMMKPNVTDADKAFVRDLSATSEEYAVAHPRSVGGVQDIRGPSDALKFATESVAENLPRALPTLAGGVLGGMAGGPVGAKLGAGLASMAQNTGEAAFDQAGEGRPVDQGYAMTQGAGYSLVDALIGGESAVARRIVGQMAKPAVEVAKRAFIASLGDVAKSAGKTALREGASEPLQSQVVGRAVRKAQTGSALAPGEQGGGDVALAAINEAAGGALAGLFLGGAQAANEYRGNKRLMANADHALTQLAVDPDVAKLKGYDKVLAARYVIGGVEAQEAATPAKRDAINAARADMLAAMDDDTRTIIEAYNAQYTKTALSAVPASVTPTFASDEAGIQTALDAMGDNEDRTVTDEASGIAVAERNGQYVVDNNNGLKIPVGVNSFQTLPEAVAFARDLSRLNQFRVTNNAAKAKFITSVAQKAYPGVRVVQLDSPLQAPQDVRARMTGGEQGFYSPKDNTVYMLLDAIDSPAQAAIILNHENLHASFEAMLAATGKTRAEVLGTADGELQEALEEAMAKKGEKVFTDPTSMERVKAKVAAWVQRKTGVRVAATDADVRLLIDQVRQHQKTLTKAAADGEYRVDAPKARGAKVAVDGAPLEDQAAAFEDATAQATAPVAAEAPAQVAVLPPEAAAPVAPSGNVTPAEAPKADVVAPSGNTAAPVGDAAKPVGAPTAPAIQSTGDAVQTPAATAPAEATAPALMSPEAYRSAYPSPLSDNRHQAELKFAVKKQLPVATEAWDAYNDAPPAGYAKDGDRYVSNGAPSAVATLSPTAADITTSKTLALRIEGVKQLQAIENIEDAGRAVDTMYDRLVKTGDVRGADFPRVDVIDTVTGDKVASVSRNGRVWGNDGKEIERIDGRGYGKPDVIDVTPAADVSKTAPQIDTSAERVQPVTPPAAKRKALAAKPKPDVPAHQQTQAEYVVAGGTAQAHKSEVGKALQRGDTVSADVMAAYPDVAAKVAASAEKAPSLRTAYANEYTAEMSARGVTVLSERTKREIRARVDAAQAPAAPKRKALAARPKAEVAARTLDHTGRVSDGRGGINGGDVFTTSSGRTTTPFPTQRSSRYASQWTIDNATAEASARGDDWNAKRFARTTILKNGEMTPSDIASLNEYLFGEQPPVQPRLTRPLVAPATPTPAESAKPVAAAPDAAVATPAADDLAAVAAREERNAADRKRRAAKAGDAPKFRKVDVLKDEDGNPVTVYHGSPVGGITAFTADNGVMFTDKRKVAEAYTWNRGLSRKPSKDGTVYEANLVMENPLVIDAVGKRNDNIPVPWQTWQPKVFGNLPKNAVNMQGVMDYAKANGYDGVIIKNMVDTADIEDKTRSTVYGVMNPEQVVMGGEEEGERGAAKFRRVTPEQDAAYAQAVERGDTAEAQRMVDEAARASGYTVGPVWHGTRAGVDFKSFEKGDIGFHFGTRTQAQARIDKEGGRLLTPFVLKGNFVRVGDQGDFWTDPQEMSDAFVKEEVFTEEQMTPWLDGSSDIESLRKFALDNGVDGMVYRNDAESDTFEDSYVAFSPTQIKSSDPITRDDAGNVIPLSERFNEATSDIRFRRTDAPADAMPRDIRDAWLSDRYVQVPKSTDERVRREQMIANLVYADNLTPERQAVVFENAQTAYKANHAKMDFDAALGRYTADSSDDVAAAVTATNGMLNRMFDAGATDKDRGMAMTAQLRLEQKGTRLGRALAMLKDPLKSPEGRRAWLTNLLNRPDDIGMAKAKLATTQDEMLAVVAPYIRSGDKALRKLMKMEVKDASGKMVPADFSKYTNAQLMDDVLMRNTLNEMQAVRSGLGDKVHEWFRNSILSGPVTLAVNPLGNFANAGLDLAIQRPFEFILNKFVKSADAPSLASTVAGYKAAKEARQLAWANFKRTVKTGDPVIGPSAGKFDESGKAWGGKFGQAVRMPTTLLTAQDQYMRTLLMAQGIADFGTREFDKLLAMPGTVLRETDREMFMQKAAQEGSPIYQKAEDQASRLLFQEPLGRFGKAAAGLRNDPHFGFLMKFVLPFIVTPANIIKTGWRKSPANLAPFLMRAATGRYSGTEAARAEGIRLGAEQAVGLLITGFIYSAMQGDDDDPLGRPVITGNRQSGGKYRPGEREFEARNEPPMSIRIGDKWYSYARVEPLATMLATTVDVLKAAELASNGREGEVPARLFNMVKGTFADRTYIKTIGDLIGILEDGDGAALTRMLQSTAAGFVPNAIRSNLRAADNMVRDMRNRDKGVAGVVTAFKRTGQMALPAASLQPEPRMDIAGRPVEKSGGTLWNALSPFRQQDAMRITKVDAMLKRFIEQNNPDNPWMPSTPQDPEIKPFGSKKAIQLSDEERTAYQREAGQWADKRLAGMTFNYDAPTEQDVERVKRIYTASRDVARNRIRGTVLRRVAAEKRKA